MTKKKAIEAILLVITICVLMWIFGESALYKFTAWFIIWNILLGNGDKVFFEAILKNTWATRRDILDLKRSREEKLNDAIRDVYVQLYKCQEEHKMRMKESMNKETSEV